MKKTIIIKGLILLVESLQKQLAEVKASYNALHDNYTDLKAEARKVVDQLESPDFSPAIGRDFISTAFSVPLPVGYDRLLIDSIVQEGDLAYNWTDKCYEPVCSGHIGVKVSCAFWLRAIANTEPTEPNTVFFGERALIWLDETPIPEGYYMLRVGAIGQKGDLEFCCKAKTYIPLDKDLFCCTIMSDGFLRRIAGAIVAPTPEPEPEPEPTKDKIIETINLGADIEPLALKCPLPIGYEMLPIHSILQAGDRWFSWQDKTYLPVKPRHIGRKVLGIGFLRSIAIL